MSRQVAGVRANETDFYPTPAWCFERLSAVDFFDQHLIRTAHEPSQGDGRITRWLGSWVPTVTSSEITEGRDFFEWNERADLIFGNPPFKDAAEFVRYSLPRAHVVIYLLRLGFLSSADRFELFEKYKPHATITLSDRPSFLGEMPLDQWPEKLREKRKNKKIGPNPTDGADYAWIVWLNPLSTIAKEICPVAPGYHFLKKK